MDGVLSSIGICSGGRRFRLYPPPGLAATTAVQAGKIGDDVMRERAVEVWREASSKEEEEEEEANIWGGSDREEMSITLDGS